MSNLANTGFDAEQEEEVREFKPLPIGEYPAVITDSGIDQHESGAQTLRMTFQVISGEYQNRLVFMRQNWQKRDWTPNKIGRSYLAHACRATGVMKPMDTSELHGKPVMISVGIERDTYKGVERVNNTVKKIMPLQGASPSGGQAHHVVNSGAEQEQPNPKQYQQPTASAGAWAKQNS